VRAACRRLGANEPGRVAEFSIASLKKGSGEPRAVQGAARSAAASPLKTRARPQRPNSQS
jgi:hypothetical protein